MRNLLLAICLTSAVLACGFATSLISPQTVASAQTGRSPAPQRPGLSRNFDQATANALAAARRELQDAAAAHRVRVQVERLSYTTDLATTLVHAPLAGIEKYGDADFEAGATILLLLVKSGTASGIRDGSYLVKAQYRRGETSGKAIFTGRDGTVAAEQELLVRTPAQSAVLFPGVYSVPEPQLIPNITSTHVWIQTPTGPKKKYVDCSGWDPPRTLYFEVK